MSPAPEAVPPLDGPSSDLGPGANLGLAEADDQAGVGVEQEGAEGGDRPSAAAVADEAWTWRQDRELFDEIVDEGLRQGLSEAEAQQQAAAAFGGKVPPPMQEPAAHLT